MASKIRETIDLLREHGVPVGPGDSKAMCTVVTLSFLHIQDDIFDRGHDFQLDLMTIGTVLREQYPEFGSDIALFNDTMAKERREEELFAILEKAAIRVEEQEI